MVVGLAIAYELKFRGTTGLEGRKKFFSGFKAV
jgi:hypothetical protein